MKNLIKYIPKDTFLNELLQQNLNNSTSQLADLWSGIFNIATLIHQIDIKLGNADQISCMNLCFISNNPLDYQNLMVKGSDKLVIQSALCKEGLQMFVSFDDKIRILSQNVAGLFLNLLDLDDKQRATIRDHFIFTTKERKKYDKYYLMSCMFGCSIDDYVSLLGSKSEKANGLLACTLPIYCGNVKRKTAEYTDTTDVNGYFGKLIQFTERKPTIVYANDGFRQYSEWCTHRIPLKGYYGQILDRLMNMYCLKLAVCLAINEGFTIVNKTHIKTAQQILEITCKEALQMFEEEMNLDNSSKFLIVLEKIKKVLLLSGSNGIQHRSLYMKVHHDIDNDTFRYIMNILHELNLIEKLKVSHNSIIYRASDTLNELNIQTLVETINLQLDN